MVQCRQDFGLFRVQFRQDSGLFRVQFRLDSGFIQRSSKTGFWFS